MIFNVEQIKSISQSQNTHTTPKLIMRVFGASHNDNLRYEIAMAVVSSRQRCAVRNANEQAVKQNNSHLLTLAL